MFHVCFFVYFEIDFQLIQSCCQVIIRPFRNTTIGRSHQNATICIQLRQSQWKVRGWSKSCQKPEMYGGLRLSILHSRGFVKRFVI